MSNIELTPQLVQRIRMLVSERPELFQTITGTKRAGRPKKSGSKIANPCSPKRKRRPRMLSSESKSKMLENLAKGRAKLHDMKQASKLSKLASQQSL